MQRKRRQRNRKKKAGGQNKGIVEEEAPFGLDALMWSATVKSQLKMVMMGTIGDFLPKLGFQRFET